MAIGIQAKLRVGQPGDIYEQEADRVADEVMRMPEPHLRQQVEEEEFILAKKREDATLEVTFDIEPQIRALHDSGQSLPESERKYFEPRFGYDFTQVRIHTDAQAAESARVVNARAFTVGGDVIFGMGEYQPETVGGRQLLAHELTHVVQQQKVGNLGSHQLQTEKNELEMHKNTPLMVSQLLPLISIGSAHIPMIQRIVRDDITQMCITEEWARYLTEEELEQQIQIVHFQLINLIHQTPEYETALSNLQILEQVLRIRRRRPMTRQVGGYSDLRLVIPYNNIVSDEAMSNPNPRSGFNQIEINRIAQNPNALEQVYFDASSGHRKAQWLVQQFEGFARGLGRYIAREINSLGCLTIINCQIHWERILFSTQTPSGQCLRTIISNEFEREAQRIGLTYEIIGHVITLILAVSAARAAIGRERVVASAAGVTRGVTRVLGGEGSDVVNLYRYCRSVPASGTSVPSNSFWTEWETTAISSASRMTGVPVELINHRLHIRVIRGAFDRYFRDAGTKFIPGEGAALEFQNNRPIPSEFIEHIPLRGSLQH